EQGSRGAGEQPSAISHQPSAGSNQSSATTNPQSAIRNPQSEAPRHNSLRFVRVGRRADNAGIIALNSRPVGAGTRREMFASIANFSDHARAIGVELRIDGNLVDARTVNLDANERSGIIFGLLPQAGGLAELRLAVDDDLAADNIAFTFLPDARRVRVGVASDNPFLLRALAVNPDLDARRIDAGTPLFSSPSVSAGFLSEFDCFVIEGAMRTDALDSGKPLLAINPSDVAGLWQRSGERENPDITSVDRSHSVNSYLSYADLHIESAPRREVASWLRPIVSGRSGGLVWAGEDKGRRVVLAGFDLAKSDLPLKIEFPIMLANSVAWLAGRDQLATERAVRAGQPVTLTSTAAETEITMPSGDSRLVAARDGSIVFADTMRAGVYEVKDAPPFAASLLSEAESNTAPRDRVKTRAGEASAQAETFYSEREAWAWIALAALAVLAIEWWVYHRRIAA
ncbi:MAG: hypothetical protein L0229_29155, partial [Blastocatellia bacterium]|nr:hypothetical protein [Blastocatellia bacterium]